MSAAAEIARPLPPRRIALVTIAALVVALLILFAGILPAEYHRDPLGLGRLLGTDKLWAPAEVVVPASAPARSRTQAAAPAQHSYLTPFRSDVLDIPLTSYEDTGGGARGKTMTVAYYRKETGTSDNGLLTAPFDGVHGWLFQNQSVKRVVVHLKLAGFYDLIPDGQPGNEKGLHARRVP